MKHGMLDHLILGMLATNTWFLKHHETGEMLIIDPADQADKIIHQVNQMGGTPVAVLLTHGHFDHMLAADQVRKTYQIPIYALEAEKTLLSNAYLNLSKIWSEPYTLEADQFLADGDEMDLAGFRICVLHTPGHTAGCGCYYIKEEGILFSGDTLFFRSMGRTDFPTSNVRQMRMSLMRLFRELPGETVVFSGHGQETTIAYEKRYNPFA